MRSLIAVVMLTMAAAASAQPAPPDVIVATGEAVVMRAPDRAFVTVTVETRAKAPRDAQRINAEAAAAGAGRAIDRVIKVEDLRESGSPVPRPMLAMARVADAPSTPIEPGLIEIHARVTLTAAMR
jgi:uncharacterized protein YggE